MGRRSITRAAVGAALCAGLALAGCSGDRDTGQGRTIETVVKRFALSHGPDACDMMTHGALNRVYGGQRNDAEVSRAHCRALSAKFQGERVEVTFVKLKTATSANATARTLDRRPRYYTVGLAKRRGRWWIDSVSPAPRPS